MKKTLISQAVARRTRVFALVCAAACLAGCGVTGPVLSGSQRGETLTGRVLGGQQPVSGASIVLFAAGTSGVGAGAVDLLAPSTITTDAAGNFDITGDYVCPTATTQVYLVARGGNPGLSGNVNNGALAMMAALGDCGNLTSASHIVVNEITTAAATWALAQFLGPDATVGATPGNANGLRNAFAAAGNLADSSTGLAPGKVLPAGATTETAKLITLANVLATCVNSDGGTACGPLFKASTSGGSVPSNTLDAALSVVRHPGNNVVAVFAAAGARGPFEPALSSAPNDWTMSITFNGGGLNLPGNLAVDSAGNVVVANYFGGVFSKFSPAGMALAANGFSGTGLSQSYGIAVDGLDNVWVTNEQSVTGTNNHHNGSVSKFSATGAELSGFGFAGGGIYYPVAVALDANGTVWVADHSSSSATLLAGDGSAISGDAGYGTSALPFPSAVAVDGDHNAWFAVQKGVARVSTAGAVSSFACCSGPAGVAIDGTGRVWVADYIASSVYELSANGAVLQQTVLSGGNGGPQGIAVDGDGNVWAANFFGNSVAELLGSTAAVISPGMGLGLDAPLSEPYGLAIDASGNVWLSNAGNDTVTEMVGVASPVRTPLNGPPVRP